MLIYIQNVSFKVIWNKRKSVVKNTNVDSFDRSRWSIPFSVYSHLQVYLKNSLIVGKFLPNISLTIVCTRNFERLTTKSCTQTSYKKIQGNMSILVQEAKTKIKMARNWFGRIWPRHWYDYSLWQRANARNVSFLNLSRLSYLFIYLHFAILHIHILIKGKNK